MSRQTIAVDVDDVLSDQKSAMIDFSNQIYGSSLTLDDFRQPGEYWSYWEMVWAVDAEEGNRRLEKFIASDFSRKQKTVDGAVSVIARLKRAYDLEIITSRRPETRTMTQEWIERHFPGIFEDVHFTGLWHEDGTASKAEICGAIGAGYLVDDNVEHCELALAAGVTPLLFGEYGWNTHVRVPAGITRVVNWHAVAEYFGV
jgi:5'(3')-deoxyribonucleotidase